MDRLEQLRKFVDWDKRAHPGKIHIADWALHEIERLQAQSEFYRQMRNANERKLAKPPSAPVGVEAVVGWLRKSADACSDTEYGHGCRDAMRETADKLERLAPQPPAEAQAQGGGEVVAWAVVGNKSGEILNVFHGTREKWLADTKYWPEHGFRTRPLVYGDTAPPIAPVGVEAVDAAVWNEVLELPDGFRVAEHLPGIWEYQFDIEDEADEDSDRKVSGTSWNHPALAAIAAWSHAYDALAKQPAAVDGAAIRYALEHARDLDDGVARVVAALAAQPGNLYVKDGDTEPHHDR